MSCTRLARKSASASKNPGDFVMYLFAEIALSPGGVISWIGVGLIAGWVGWPRDERRRLWSGQLGDIVVGLIGRS